MMTDTRGRRAEKEISLDKTEESHFLHKKSIAHVGCIVRQPKGHYQCSEGNIPLSQFKRYDLCSSLNRIISDVGQSILAFLKEARVLYRWYSSVSTAAVR